MTRLKFIIMTVVLLAFATSVLAQQDCPAIVKDALAAVDSACAATARNQACYGNVRLEVTQREGVSDFHFAQAGDITNVASIAHLQLSSLSTTDESWGIALMKLQASLPNTLPGQNLTFLLFGDVELENQIASAPEVSITAARNANVRSQPISGNNVIASLKSGQEIIANGRLADNTWVRIKLEGDKTDVGWVSASLIKGDLDGLTVIDPKTPQLRPMQSFYFKTGLTDRPCDQAPDSGILVQSPQGAGHITFTANGVDITLGSTVYMQADDKYLTISVVEGAATLVAAGQTQIVPAGSVAQVPLGTDGLASGPPEAPQSYDAAALQTLPLGLSVWETVEVAPALSTEEIATAIEALQTPQSGTWSLRTTAGGTSACFFKASSQSIRLTFVDSDSMAMFIPQTGITLNFSRSGDKTYIGSIQTASGSNTMVLNFTSDTTYTGTIRFVNAQCDVTRTISGSRSS